MYRIAMIIPLIVTHFSGTNSAYISQVGSFSTCTLQVCFFSYVDTLYHLWWIPSVWKRGYCFFHSMEFTDSSTCECRKQVCCMLITHMGPYHHYTRVLIGGTWGLPLKTSSSTSNNLYICTWSSIWIFAFKGGVTFFLDNNSSFHVAFLFLSQFIDNRK